MKGDEKRGTLGFLDKQTKHPEKQKPRTATSVRACLSPAAWAGVAELVGQLALFHCRRSA